MEANKVDVNVPNVPGPTERTPGAQSSLRYREKCKREDPEKWAKKEAQRVADIRRRKSDEKKKLKDGCGQEKEPKKKKKVAGTSTLNNNSEPDNSKQSVIDDNGLEEDTRRNEVQKRKAARETDDVEPIIKRTRKELEREHSESNKNALSICQKKLEQMSLALDAQKKEKQDLERKVECMEKDRESNDNVVFHTVREREQLKMENRRLNDTLNGWVKEGGQMRRELDGMKVKMRKAAKIIKVLEEYADEMEDELEGLREEKEALLRYISEVVIHFVQKERREDNGETSGDHDKERPVEEESAEEEEGEHEEQGEHEEDGEDNEGGELYGEDVATNFYYYGRLVEVVQTYMDKLRLGKRCEVEDGIVQQEECEESRL